MTGADEEEKKEFGEGAVEKPKKRRGRPPKTEKKVDKTDARESTKGDYLVVTEDQEAASITGCSTPEEAANILGALLAVVDESKYSITIWKRV